MFISVLIVSRIFFLNGNPSLGNGRDSGGSSSLVGLLITSSFEHLLLFFFFFLPIWPMVSFKRTPSFSEEKNERMITMYIERDIKLLQRSGSIFVRRSFHKHTRPAGVLRDGRAYCLFAAARRRANEPADRLAWSIANSAV